MKEQKQLNKKDSGSDKTNRHRSTRTSKLVSYRASSIAAKYSVITTQRLDKETLEIQKENKESEREREGREANLGWING